MKIVFLDADTLGSDADFSPIEKKGDFIIYQSSTPEDVLSRISDCDVLIVNKVIIGSREIEAAAILKLICVAATGTNNIDIEYALKRGIAVRNAVDYSTESVAQTTIGSLLALVNKTHFFDSRVKSGVYSRSNNFTDTGGVFTELKGKSFGVIGMGNIGKRVASIAESLGCRIMYYATSGKAHYDKYLSVPLEVLLRECDIVSIHAPLNSNTSNLLTLDKLRLMKSHSILINMGRGGIVNEKELAFALDNSIIGGAVVDVYEKEPISSHHPFLKLKDPSKVILTPHIGWASIEARRKLIEKIAENIYL